MRCSRPLPVLLPLLLPVLGAFACQGELLAQGYTLRLVAQSGDMAPGTFGGHFTWLGWPTLNASGQVAFAAGSDGVIGETGLWRSVIDDPQSCELIIGQDYPVPGSPAEVRFGVFDPSFHHPLLNDDGNVGFSAPLTNVPDPANGVFRMVNSSIQRVAVPGDIAPGSAGTLTFASISNLPSFNASNALGFAATLAGPGVNASNDRAFFAHWFGGVQMYLREGNSVPGFPGSQFALSQNDFAALEDSGAISFAAATTGATNVSWSLWRGWPGAFNAIALQGEASPGGGTFHGNGGFLNFWSVLPGIDCTSFAANVVLPTGTFGGLWGESNGALSFYAVENTLGPLGTYESLQPYAPQIAADGTAVFWASFVGGSDTTDSAILRSPVGGPAMVMLREGDAASGFAPGVVYDELAAWWNTLPVINDAHQVLVSGYVRGPGIGVNNDKGLWVIDPNGAVVNILREGQFLSLGGGAPRQVKDWVVTSGISQHGGRRPGFNSRGDIAMVLSFNNNTSAVVVAQRPPLCAADINTDGVVDAQDLALLLGAWGSTSPVGEGGDVDWDGDTDGADLAVLLGAWGVCE